MSNNPERKRRRRARLTVPPDFNLPVRALPAASRVFRGSDDPDRTDGVMRYAVRSLVDEIRRMGGGAAACDVTIDGTRLLLYVRAPNVNDGGGLPGVCFLVHPADLDDPEALPPGTPMDYVRKECEVYMRRLGLTA
jgi:hypothetical protein